MSKNQRLEQPLLPISSFSHHFIFTNFSKLFYIHSLNDNTDHICNKLFTALTLLSHLVLSSNLKSFSAVIKGTSFTTKVDNHPVYPSLPHWPDENENCSYNLPPYLYRENNDIPFHSIIF